MSKPYPLRLRAVVFTLFGFAAFLTVAQATQLLGWLPLGAHCQPLYLKTW